VRGIIYLFDLLGLRSHKRCTMEEHGGGMRAIRGIPLGRPLPKCDQSTIPRGPSSRNVQNIFGRCAGFNLRRAIFALPRVNSNLADLLRFCPDAEYLNPDPQNCTDADLFRRQHRVSGPIFRPSGLAYLTLSFDTCNINSDLYKFKFF